MATVPRYDGPQVETQALPGARLSGNVSQEALSGRGQQAAQIGQGLSNFGRTVNNIAVDIQERENAAMVFSAETALKDDYLQFENSIKARKGHDAWGATDEAEKWFAEQSKVHGQGLGNDRQRAIFGQQLTKLRQQAMTSISAYEIGERDRTLAEAAQASIVGSINLAASAATDGLVSANGDGKPSVVQDAVGGEAVIGGDPVPALKGDIIKRIDVLAQMGGWSAEKREMEVNKYVTVMHRQVLGALVDTNPDLAQKYYTDHKVEIDGTERAGIEKALKVGGLRQQAQNAVDDILSKGLTEAESLAYARKEYKGEAEDEITQRVKARFSEVDQLREQGQRTAADSAWKAYSQRQNIDDVPTSVIASMDGRDIETLRDHAKTVASGASVKTNPSTYYGLRVMATDEPASFAKVDLRRYIGQLSTEDFEEFVKMQTSAPGDLKDAATLQQQLSITHDLLGLKKGDADKKGLFDKAVIDAVNNAQTHSGKKLNYDERQVIIDRMTIEGDLARGFFNDTEGRYYDVAGKPESAQFAPEVPDADRSLIAEKFKAKHGRDPSDDEVVNAYKIWKGLN